ncbi:MAG: hypothetical protein ABJF50_07350 [Paracoccaceae bacterium]|uniref:hypothetical protein n=1 Tax=Yoonia sp. TaxID=2212373 RepID=UPI0032750ED7
MEKKLLITAPVTDGDWSFGFQVTHEQAFEILNARVGDRVMLNEVREQIHVQNAQMLYHTKAANFMGVNDGSTSEGLQREAVLSILEILISENAWDDVSP